MSAKYLIKVYKDGDYLTKVRFGTTSRQVADFAGCTPEQITWDMPDARRIAGELLESKKQKKLQQTVYLGGNNFNANVSDMAKLTSAVVIFETLQVPLPADYTWINSDGLAVPVPNTNALATLFKKVFAHVDGIDKEFQTAMGDVENAETIDDIVDIVRDF